MSNSKPRGARVNIDDIDRAIIRELQVDGRMSYSTLGPKVGLSRAAARQRVQRLLESGQLQVVAMTEPFVLGTYVEAMVGIEVDGDVRAVAAELVQHDEFVYVVLMTGGFDILVEVVCEDTAQLLHFVNDVIRTIPGVRSTQTFTYLQIEKLTYRWSKD